MISFGEFFSQVFSNPALAITALLTMGVILVNGWTDAPNAKTLLRRAYAERKEQ